MEPHDIPSGPWETIGTDMVGELPESGGYNAIITISDHFTKRACFIPSHTTLNAEGMARTYRDHIFAQFGLPRKMIHDRGPQYHARFMKELYRLLDITSNYTSAYHPQTNRQSERINQGLEHYLRVFCSYHQDDWHEWLPLAEFVFNDHEHASTKMTPFYADTGRHPYKGTSPRYQSNNESAQTFVDRMVKIREELSATLSKAKTDMKRFYDAKRTPGVEHAVGSKVMLDGRNISTDRPMKKLDDVHFGPFKVLEKVGRSSYRLELPKTWKKIHPVFHEVLLTAYREPEFPTQPKVSQPPPDLIDGEEEYKVEHVLDCRHNRSRKRDEWLIKWKNYPATENTWEPWENLEHAHDLVMSYHDNNPRRYKPRIAS